MKGDTWTDEGWLLLERSEVWRAWEIKEGGLRKSSEGEGKSTRGGVVGVDKGRR